MGYTGKLNVDGVVKEVKKNLSRDGLGLWQDQKFEEFGNAGLRIRKEPRELILEFNTEVVDLFLHAEEI